MYPSDEYYDLMFSDREDQKFYHEIVQTFGQPVLEVGCGSGRILKYLAAAKVEVHGIDISANRISILKDQLATEHEYRAKLHCCDMRSFDLGQVFPLVIMPFRVFQHALNPSDQIETLKCISRHLRPNGILAFDIFNPSIHFLANDSFFSEFGDGDGIELSDRRHVKMRYRVKERDWFNQIDESEEIFYVTYPDGRTERIVEQFRVRWTFRYELEHLLNRCGFAVLELYSDFKKRPFGYSYPGELIVVAQRKS